MGMIVNTFMLKTFALVLIDRTLGTAFGDMTGNGNLAASFDGVTNTIKTSCSRSAGATVSNSFIGKTLAAPKIFGQAKLYAANDDGFVQSIDPTVTINIRGKNGAAPASNTDGTIVGTLVFTDTANESGGRTVTSTDLVTVWDHLFADISHNGVANRMTCAEVELWEWA